MRRTALALSLLVLAFPTTALAQSAGDNQYQDPFANQGNSQGGHSGTSGSGTTSSGTGSSGTTSSGTSSSGASSSPGSTAGSGSAGTSASGTGSSRAGTAGSGQLPFTGYDTVFSVVLGAVLLLSGVTVRATVRDRR